MQEIAIISITEPKILIDNSKKDNYIVERQGSIIYKINGIVKTKIIEEGFHCDLSSIPVIFQSIFPKTLPALCQGGVAHDTEYRNSKRICNTRDEADMLYKKILEFYGFDLYVPEFNVIFFDKLKWNLFKIIKFITRESNSQVFYMFLKYFGKKYYIV
jgi:hypothetical protein